MTGLAFDIGLMRPGCVLLQVALGGDSDAAQQFPTESWLLAPTDGMRVYNTSPAQLAMLVERVRAEYSAIA